MSQKLISVETDLLFVVQGSPITSPITMFSQQKQFTFVTLISPKFLWILGQTWITFRMGLVKQFPFFCIFSLI